MAAVKWASERDRDVSRKREKSASDRIVVVPQCQDRERRERLEKDDIAWLMYYFGVDSEVRDPFWYEFTAQQRRMISAFGSAIRYGGDQAVAASRGEGKTTILERLITKYALQGVLTYSVLFQATGALADNSLDSIKIAIEENPLLAADYPEVCIPVQALENTPNRAHYQLVSGLRHDNGAEYESSSSKFTWCGQEIIFPKVPGSPSSGAIIATRGLDSAVRGLKKRGRRPQLAAIDDPDTEETSRSEEQAKKLEERIDKAIGGLGSQQKAIARILLCTIPSRIAAAYRFTDPLQKPSWKGIRFRYLIKPPTNQDLWDEYVQLRSAEFLDFAEGRSEDEHCRASHKFFADRFDAMTLGAEVANPNRFNGELLPDGTQVELCSLQRYYNEVARLGYEAVATEYDNDPPETDGPLTSGLSSHKIQRRLSGYPQRVVPSDCTVLTRGVDVQARGLYWVVKAWKPDATNYVVDYGVTENVGDLSGDGLELSLMRCVADLMQRHIQNPYVRPDGEEVEIGLTLIDSGWESPTIYKACRNAGLGVLPSKGHGKSNGCASPSFNGDLKKTYEVFPGDGWVRKRSKASREIWIVHCDADRWKSFEHARWLTPEDRPGAAYIYGAMSDSERANLRYRVPAIVQGHQGFAMHLTSEEEVEDMVRGVLKRFWKAKPGRVNNHYLDASYLANVAASVKGIRLLGAARTNAQPVLDLAALQKAARP